MLTRLYIQNFALITESEIRFGEGLNILTGETGAGKSLLLGALGLILGKRVDYGMIFDPGKKCIVEAGFQKIPAHTLKILSKFEDFDLEDEQILIRREASPSGKSRAFINDTPVSLQVLKEVAGLLVDLHGQNENQLLLSPNHQLRLLDQYADATADATQFGKTLKELRQLQTKLKSLLESEKDARQQEDYFRFQVKELEEAELDEEEETELDQQIGRLQNAEEIKDSLGLVTEGLYNDENSLYNQLSVLRSSLRKVAHIDAEIAAHLEALEDIAVRMQDTSYELEKLNEGVDLDSSDLAKMEARLDTYNRLKMKFSAGSVTELISIRDGFAEKLAQIGSLEDEIEDARASIEKLIADLARQGVALEKKRQKAIPQLEKAVNQLLDDVGFKNAAFTAALDRNFSESGSVLLDGKTIAASPDGLNKIEFRIRTNKGAPEGPLSQIASGGEVSRVMLAIKSALAGKAALAVLIFDEIDTGISGEVARKVGHVMRRLGSAYQIIAITHLPQIAGLGNQHFQIYKEDQGDKTISQIRALQTEDRVEELAKMISGATLTDSAIENARELLKER